MSLNPLMNSSYNTGVSPAGVSGRNRNQSLESFYAENDLTYTSDETEDLLKDSQGRIIKKKNDPYSHLEYDTTNSLEAKEEMARDYEPLEGWMDDSDVERIESHAPIDPLRFNMISGESSDMDPDKYDFQLRVYGDNDEIRAQDQGIIETVAKGAGRLVGSTALKFLQGVGFVASAPGALATGDLSTMTQNAFSGYFEDLEESMKEELLPIYATNRYDDPSFWKSMWTYKFWFDEVVDGLAFFTSAYLGSAGISAISKGLRTYSKIGRELTKLTNAKRTGDLTKAGVDRLSNISSIIQEADLLTMSAYNTISEAAFEAKDTQNQVKEALDWRVKAGIITEEEAKEKAAQAGLESFWHNTIILMPSNYVTNSFLFKKFKPNKKIGLRFNPETGTFENASKALTGKEKLSIFGKNAFISTFSEGFWEENAQTASQDMLRIKYAPEYIDEWKGTVAERMLHNPSTKEGQKSIFLGALIGIIPGGIGSVHQAKTERNAEMRRDIALGLALERSKEGLSDFYHRELIIDPETGNPQGYSDKILLDHNNNPIISELRIQSLMVQSMEEYADAAVAMEALAAGNTLAYEFMQMYRLSSIGVNFFALGENGAELMKEWVEFHSNKEIEDLKRAGHPVDIEEKKALLERNQKLAEQFSNMYEYVQDRFVGLMHFGNTEVALGFKNSLQLKVYQQGVHQLFWNEQISKAEEIQAELETKAVTTELSDAEKLSLDEALKTIKAAESAIEYSREYTKQLLNEKLQREEYELHRIAVEERESEKAAVEAANNSKDSKDSKDNKDTKTEDPSTKESEGKEAKPTTSSNVIEGDNLPGLEEEEESAEAPGVNTSEEEGNNSKSSKSTSTGSKTSTTKIPATLQENLESYSKLAKNTKITEEELLGQGFVQSSKVNDATATYQRTIKYGNATVTDTLTLKHGKINNITSSVSKEMTDTSTGETVHAKVSYKDDSLDSVRVSSPTSGTVNYKVKEGFKDTNIVNTDNILQNLDGISLAPKEEEASEKKEEKKSKPASTNPVRKEGSKYKKGDKTSHGELTKEGYLKSQSTSPNSDKVTPYLKTTRGRREVVNIDKDGNVVSTAIATDFVGVHGNGDIFHVTVYHSDDKLDKEYYVKNITAVPDGKGGKKRKNDKTVKLKVDKLTHNKIGDPIDNINSLKDELFEKWNLSDPLMVDESGIGEEGTMDPEDNDGRHSVAETAARNALAQFYDSIPYVSYDGKATGNARFVTFNEEFETVLINATNPSELILDASIDFSAQFRRTNSGPLSTLTEEEIKALKELLERDDVTEEEVDEFLKPLNVNSRNNLVDIIPIQLSHKLVSSKNLYMHSSMYDKHTSTVTSMNMPANERIKTVKKELEQQQLSIREQRRQVLKNILLKKSAQLQVIGRTFGHYNNVPGAKNNIGTILKKTGEHKNSSEVIIGIGKSDGSILVGKSSIPIGFGAPGAVFIRTISTVNGSPAVIQVNPSKLSEEHANLVLDAFKFAHSKGNGYKSNFNHNKVSGLTVGEFLNLMVYYGDKNTNIAHKKEEDKARLVDKMLYVDTSTQMLHFGSDKMNIHNFTENDRKRFVKWATENKNYAINAKMLREKIGKSFTIGNIKYDDSSTTSNYNSFVIDNNFITTDMGVVKGTKSLFKQPTAVYKVVGSDTEVNAASEAKVAEERKNDKGMDELLNGLEAMEEEAAAVNAVSAEEAFSTDPLLSKIGTFEEYTDYIDSILDEEVITETTDPLYQDILAAIESSGDIIVDCSGSGGATVKAADGLRSKFSVGRKWELVKDLKGYPSHAKGGVDITLGSDGFSFARGSGNIRAAHGLVLPSMAMGGVMGTGEENYTPSKASSTTSSYLPIQGIDSFDINYKNVDDLIARAKNREDLDIGGGNVYRSDYGTDDKGEYLSFYKKEGNRFYDIIGKSKEYYGRKYIDRSKFEQNEFNDYKDSVFQKRLNLLDPLVNVKRNYNTDDYIMLSQDRYNTARVPKELINELYEVSKKEGIDVYDLLKVVGRESMFAYKNSRNVNDPTSLVSGWNLLEGYKPKDLDMFLYENKLPFMGVDKDFHGVSAYPKDREAYNEFLNSPSSRSILEKYDKELESTKFPDYGEYNPFVEVARMIKSNSMHKYNPGDPKYLDKLEVDKKSLIRDKKLTEYLNSISKN